MDAEPLRTRTLRRDIEYPLEERKMVIEDPLKEQTYMKSLFHIHPRPRHSFGAWTLRGKNPRSQYNVLGFKMSGANHIIQKRIFSLISQE